jgi:hypothetical protein
VRLFDILLGRTKPVEANLDRLFGLASAATTLQASESMVSTGHAGVCFKPAAGIAFDATEKEIGDLLRLDSGDGSAVALRQSEDSYGYRWVVVSSDDFETLVTRAHFVNTTLQEHGYGPQLLCSVFGFKPAPDAPAGRNKIYLVYLYKRGSFYPFVPLGGERRDNEAELRLKTVLAGDLSIEPDLDRWFPLWELPVDTP